MDVPLSHDPPCGICGHGAHFLPCDRAGCDCHDVPVPGVYPDMHGGVMAETTKITADLLRVLTTSGAQEWFDTPMARLGGLTPHQAIDAGRTQTVAEIAASYSDPSFS